MRANFLAILVVLFISGCASNALNVTYDSDPPGAVLYEGSQRFGYTPVVLQYQVFTEDDRKRGYKIVRGTSVRWTSGASVEIKDLRIDFANGLYQTFTFRRPADHPNREADERFALELEKLKAMKRQSEAAEWQAGAAMFGGFGGIGQPQKSTTTNCISRPSGLGSVNTTCY